MARTLPKTPKAEEKTGKPTPKPASEATTKKGSMNRRRTNNHITRTNTRCKTCSTDLRKSEGEICDECRLTALGWKKMETTPSVN